ncbi:MAG: sugar phosphate isomerase/epimerase [Oscillospiraceae bacterium]|nr:sugar phosphate isomerase/epimerase [Oscillospiraceae bacterium]
MRLSISNIAWSAEFDSIVYPKMMEYGFSGLEIAPTRIYPELPYDHTHEFKQYCQDLNEHLGLRISSMQSILNVRNENLFEVDGAGKLLDYLEKAFSFGESAGGCNLVFGCPKNRIMPVDKDLEDAYNFFETASVMALEHNCVLALEANPPIYGTNFINTTSEAFDFARNIPGLKVNLDFGTILDRGEDLSRMKDNLYLVNHVHISEPGLVPVQRRKEHEELASLLKDVDYDGYVSIEMKRTDLETIDNTMDYIRRVFL